MKTIIILLIASMLITNCASIKSCTNKYGQKSKTILKR